MLNKFSETKLSPSQNHIIICSFKYQTDSEFKTPKNFLALKISDPKYVNLPSILDPKYFFQSSKSLTPNMFVFPKFQTPNMYMITPVIKVNEFPPWDSLIRGKTVEKSLITWKTLVKFKHRNSQNFSKIFDVMRSLNENID